MDIILVPGLWLDGASWDEVATPLRWAGHEVVAITPPGLESVDTDRSGITLGDHVAAVTTTIDAVPGDRPVLLVGHSLGCAVVHAAADARPDRVARVVHVGGFPTPDGEVLGADFATEGADVPMPDLGDFDDADVEGLDDELRAHFRARAIPSPAGVTSSPQRLTDERRFDVPVTMVCPEYRSSDLREWVAADAAPVRELARLRDVTYVDLPTGHWPQFTRPVDLARLIDSCTRQRSGDVLDDVGRIEPPIASGEVETLVGYLEYQRATFAWKCIGPDAAGLAATVGVSTMTLGGLIKHMAFVEDHWFSYALGANDRCEPFGSVDWTADHDWEWNSAADDSPGELATLWYSLVDESRRFTDLALAAGGLDALAARSGELGTVSLRWILVHMIEEYARHNGHADLLREAVDGSTGE